MFKQVVSTHPQNSVRGIIFPIFRLKFIVLNFEISRHANLVMLWSMLRTAKISHIYQRLSF